MRLVCDHNNYRWFPRESTVHVLFITKPYYISRVIAYAWHIVPEMPCQPPVCKPPIFWGVTAMNLFPILASVSTPLASYMMEARALSSHEVSMWIKIVKWSTLWISVASKASVLLFKACADCSIWSRALHHPSLFLNPYAYCQYTGMCVFVDTLPIS